MDEVRQGQRQVRQDQRQERQSQRQVRQGQRQGQRQERQSQRQVEAAGVRPCGERRSQALWRQKESGLVEREGSQPGVE